MITRMFIKIWYNSPHLSLEAYFIAAISNSLSVTEAIQSLTSQWKIQKPTNGNKSFVKNICIYQWAIQAAYLIGKKLRESSVGDEDWRKCFLGEVRSNQKGPLQLLMDRKLTGSDDFSKI